MKPSPGYGRITLRPAENTDGDDGSSRAAHIAFIDAPIAQNKILLGGALTGDAGDIDAAYVVRVASVAEAGKVAAEDPLVVNRICRPQGFWWEFVAINPEAL